MDQPGGSNMPPGQQPAPPPPASPPPPPAGWQSTPQQPGPPPMGGGQMGSSMPAWTSNITARNTMTGVGGMAIANMPDRIIAWIIDAIIIGIAGYIISAILGSVLRETRTDTFFGVPVVVTGPSTVGQLIAAALLIALSAGYFIYTWSRVNGQTVGNKVMKISVRDAATGGPLSQQQAINRWLVLGLPLALYSLTYFLGGLGLIIWLLVLVYEIYLLYTTANSPTRQGFHDTFAKTVVAKLAM